ncbi:MAG: hypothetical protein HW388_67 [Dehalococcoidia bacterium]|nr:hypothetical protein [Dehalococcoidia bacterium]
MFPLLYRSLVHDRSSALLSVLAVGAAILLVMVLEGFQVGMWRQIRAYREHLPVQLITARAGVEGASFTRSALPPDVADQVRAVPGVRAVHPVVNVPMIYTQGNKKTTTTIVGYHGVGGPWRLKEGRDLGGPGEVVVDYALARANDLVLGDHLDIYGRDFRVVGLSAETASWFGSYFFISLEDAFTLTSVGREAPSAGAPSSLLVEVEPGAQVSRVRTAIEAAVPAVDVFTPGELAAKDVAIVRDLMGSVLRLLVGVAYGAGVLVIGLTLYAAVFERLREYGIMKAIGARNARLYGYVLGQVIAFAAAGFVVGVLASFGVAALIGWLLPKYLVLPWDGGVLLRAGVATIIMASVASLIPVRQVAGVDPALVFRQ